METNSVAFFGFGESSVILIYPIDLTSKGVRFPLTVVWRRPKYDCW